MIGESGEMKRMEEMEMGEGGGGEGEVSGGGEEIEGMGLRSRQGTEDHEIS